MKIKVLLRLTSLRIHAKMTVKAKGKKREKLFYVNEISVFMIYGRFLQQSMYVSMEQV